MSEAGYRTAMLDWLACCAGGAGHAASRAARSAGDGLLDRVAALAVAGHVLDFDDTFLPGVAHLSAPTAPAAVALGAELGVGVEEALSAYAAGFEAMGRMARAGHPTLYGNGWHPTAVCGSVGAAVAGSRLLGLEDAAERSAVAISLLRAAGLRSAFGSAGKSIQVGLAAAAGVAAARLAGGGAEVGLDRVLEGEAGFGAVFGEWLGDQDPGGEPAITENWIKAYPCCLQTHGAIEVAMIAASRGSDLGQIEVIVHPLSLQAAAISEPADGLEAKFSIPYLTAFSLLRGPPGTESFARLDPEVAGLASERVSVSPDPSLRESEAVLTADGVEVARVGAALGSPERPLDPEVLAAKRRSLAGESLEGALDDDGRPVSELALLLEG